MMGSEKSCKKCCRILEKHVTCYQCHSIYHPSCLSNLPGFFVNEQGFTFCCGDIQEEKPTVQYEALLENIKIEENETDDFHNLIHIFDVNVEMGIADRAKKTIPKNVLEVKELSLSDHGIFALRNIPECVYFGPYEGLEGVKSPNGMYIWRIKSGKLIDVNTEEYSNWIRYVNCADNINIQNLAAFQYKRRIYYRTLREICAGEELFISFQNSSTNLKLNIIEYFCPDIQDLKNDIYNCISCSYGFSDEKLLVTHKKVCPYNKSELTEFNVSKEVFICPTCKIEFSNVEFYTEHKAICVNYVCTNERKLEPTEISDKEKTHQCPICKKSFKEKHHLIRHRQVHNVTRTKDFVCPHCNKSFFQKGHLTRHVNEIHTKNKNYECSRCGLITSHASSIAKHKLLNNCYPHKNTKLIEMNVHEEIYICSICNMEFSNTKLYAEHKAVCMENVCSNEKKLETVEINLKDENYLCPICKKSFKQKHHLTSHEKVHDATRTKHFFCLYCDKSFFHKGDLSFHVNKIHTENMIKIKEDTLETDKEENRQCPICKKSFKGKHQLIRHKEVHNAIRPKNFFCPYCNKGFFQKGHLTFHMNKKHPENMIEIKENKLETDEVSHKGKTRQCPICKKIFKGGKHQLIRHKEVHNAIRPKKFFCPYCNKGFFQKGHLTRHVDEIHRGNKKYECSQCKFTTSKSASFKRHTLLYHDIVIRKFKCNICPYISLSSKQISYHIYKHSKNTEVMPLIDSKGNQRLSERNNFTIENRLHLKRRKTKKNINKRSNKREEMDLNDNKDNFNEKLYEEKLTEKNNSTIENQPDLKRKKKEEHVCPYCKKTCFSVNDRLNHMNAIHFNKKYKCVQCPFVTRWRSTIKSHTLAHHCIGQKMLRCFHCDYTTNAKFQLKLHMYKHMTDKPYKCQYENCGFQGATSRHLKEHIMRAHTFEKPFQCDKCDSKYVQQSNLIEHIYRKHSKRVS